MSKAVTFELSGETAFFKKPDVNANIYFTYSHIPKVALLGLFGAILGYGGYTAQSQDLAENGETEENVFPEFYQKLQHLKVAIVPHGSRGYFPRKIQNFNNSVGYASFEQGNNLIVKEQWLEKPHWTVYVLDDGSDVYRGLEEALLTKRAVYLPYLGKNDHPAKIWHPRVVELNETENEQRIHSLFLAKDVKLGGFGREKNRYFYREMLPRALESKLNSYVFEEFMHTNRLVVQIHSQGTIFLAEKRCIAFF